MIKLTFEGRNYTEVFAAIWEFLRGAEEFVQESEGEGESESAPPAAPPKAPPKAAKPTEVEARRRQEQTAKAKARAAKVAKSKSKASAPEPTKIPEPVPAPEPGPGPLSLEDIVIERPGPEVLDPVQLAAIRVKTTKDLQAAYADGRHKQVLELLAKYGNGAKSFRELQIQDFVPIRKAIDEGALA